MKIENTVDKDSHHINPHSGGITPKVEMYKWQVVDTPGDFIWIDKKALYVDHAYQRDDSNEKKILRLASNWSWVGCGAICVAMRGRDFYVIDGQHRVLAARRRSDISNLPCIVFVSSGVKEEARGFLLTNTERKPVSAIAKFRARSVAGDDLAEWLVELLDSEGITISHRPTKPREAKSIALFLRRASENKDNFKRSLLFCVKLCGDEMPITEVLLDGLIYLDRYIMPLSDRRFSDRLIHVGPRKLIDAAKRAAQLYVRGGSKIWASGMLLEINKGLRNKFGSDDIAQ